MRKELVVSILMVLAIVCSVMFMFKSISNSTGNPITGSVISENLDSDNYEIVSSPQIVEPNKDYIVDIKIFKFYPEELRIRVGDSVTWVNYDKAKHKIYTGIHTDGSVLIDSGFLNKGESYTKIFDIAGVYDYWSAAWPYVQGQIIVEMPVRN